MLSSVPSTVDAVRRGHDIRFGALVLGAGPMRDALITAAHHGAHVEVTLQRDPYRSDAAERAENRRSARLLKAAGATVTLRERATAPSHLKAAVVDGTAFLCDRNWPRDGRTLVVADDAPADVALVERTLHDGRGGATPALATRKDGALRAEARLIDAAGDAPVTVETEAFGYGPVGAALRRHAERGAPTTLIVAARDLAGNVREQHALDALRAEGVDVRTGGADEKLALCGDAVWIGSANATFAARDEAAQTDWGLTSRAPRLVEAVRAALARDAARSPR
ncbi:MAG TPA: hypothetical protein VGN14_13370 [Candidatus Elarobacter sp.]|jgi:phosphatidylserine/phosphatidylglycerophosphate/cardiolipin synthase-like enzyme